MTQVVFKFQKPDGSPYVAAEFTVALRRTGLNDPGDSVVLPASYEAVTDDTGSFVLDLAPSSSPYYIRSMEDIDLDEDQCKKYAVSYRFYVPDSDVPVQAQDLFLAPPPGSVAWDEAALARLTQAVAEATASSASATASAATATAAANEALEVLGDVTDLTTRVAAAEDEIVLLEAQREFNLTPGDNITIDRTDPLNPVITAAGSVSVWGELTGTLSDQLDLQAAFDDKVDKAPGLGLSELSFTQADKDKLDNAATETHNKGYYDSPESLVAAHPVGVAGDFAFADLGVGQAPRQYIWDVSDADWVAGSGSGGSMTPVDVKTAYESNPNTNAFTDADETKLDGIEDGAQVNAVAATQVEAETGTEPLLRSWSPLRVKQAIAGWWNGSAEKTKLDGIAANATANSSDSILLARANHTGTQLADTISNFAASVRSTLLTGLSGGTNEAIAATDNALQAWAKLQAQLTAHVGQGGNAHPAATSAVAGFMSGTDKTKLDTLPAAPAPNAKFYLLKDRNWVEWVSSNPMTTLGDMVYGGANGVPTRLAKGVDGNVLTLVGGLPSWQASSQQFRGVSTFTSTAGQSTFNIPAGFTPGQTSLTIDGVDIYSFQDTNGTDVVLTGGYTTKLNQQVQITYYKTFTVADALPAGAQAADSAKLGGLVATSYVKTADLTSFVNVANRVATAAGQTVFATGLPINGTPLVFVNGARISEFTAVNGATNITLTTGVANIGDEVCIVQLQAFAVANALPNNGTAADSSKFNGQLASFYATEADRLADRAALEAKIPGIGQVWTDMKASRAPGQVYQNTGTKERKVNIIVGGGALNTLIQAACGTGVTGGTTLVNEVLVAQYQMYANTSQGTLSFSVPPGGYYTLKSANVGTIFSWAELA